MLPAWSPLTPKPIRAPRAGAASRTPKHCDAGPSASARPRIQLAGLLAGQGDMPGAFTELARLVGVAKADQVTLVLSEARALMRVGDIRLTCNIIDGQFPDHRQLVPDTFEHEVVFDRAELLAALGRIAVLAQHNTPVRLSFGEGEVRVSAISEQVGEGHESLPVAFRGDPLEIGFNVEFLRAGVDSVRGDALRLGLISPLRPGLLRGESDDFRYLLMPIRLNG